MAYFNDGEEIKCPYCGEKHRLETCDSDMSDGGQNEIYCDNCDKTFTVVVSLSFSFETFCGESENDHACDFKPYSWKGEPKSQIVAGEEQIYVKCSRCENTKFIPVTKLKIK
jgi:uncharacterized Zn-finger protein